jgi:hypothetical protein
MHWHRWILFLFYFFYLLIYYVGTGEFYFGSTPLCLSSPSVRAENAKKLFLNICPLAQNKSRRADSSPAKKKNSQLSRTRCIAPGCTTTATYGPEKAPFQKGAARTRRAFHCSKHKIEGEVDLYIFIYIYMKRRLFRRGLHVHEFSTVASIKLKAKCLWTAIYIGILW